jgi:TRAP-type C4-dicarboxylate transport system permease small subunit
MIRGFYNIGIFCIIVMMLLTVADVLLRFLLNSPILGAYEISEYLMVVLVFSALAYTEKVRGHVKVDTFYSRFPPRLRGILDCITNLFGVCVLFLIAWTNVKMAYTKWNFGDITGSLPIPVYPMHIVIAAGSLLFCLALLAYFLNAAARLLRK